MKAVWKAKKINVLRQVVVTSMNAKWMKRRQYLRRRKHCNVGRRGGNADLINGNYMPSVVAVNLDLVRLFNSSNDMRGSHDVVPIVEVDCKTCS